MTDEVCCVFDGGRFGLVFHHRCASCICKEHVLCNGKENTCLPCFPFGPPLHTASKVDLRMASDIAFLLHAPPACPPPHPPRARFPSPAPYEPSKKEGKEVEAATRFRCIIAVLLIVIGRATHKNLITMRLRRNTQTAVSRPAVDRPASNLSPSRQGHRNPRVNNPWLACPAACRGE